MNPNTPNASSREVTAKFQIIPLLPMALSLEAMKYSIVLSIDNVINVYRNYATLYFVFIVDASESELAIMDLIQTFVETLDKCFPNVCELDLVLNMDRVCNL
jgi:hypothetical protein